MTTPQPLTLHTDGGARGNPGQAAAGIVFHDTHGQVITSFSSYLGNTTNNQAEYRALIIALEHLKDHSSDFPGTSELHIFMDSELIIRQLQGIYKVKHPQIIPLFQKVQVLLLQFSFPITFTHVPRSQNGQADLLVNQELDHH